MPAKGITEFFQNTIYNKLNSKYYMNYINYMNTKYYSLHELLLYELQFQKITTICL